MGLNLRYSVDSYTNHNQQSCTAKIKRYIEFLDEKSWHNADNTQIYGSDNSQSYKCFIEKFSSFFTGSNSRNKTTILLKIFSNVIRLKSDSCIEKTEKDDHPDIHYVIINGTW